MAWTWQQVGNDWWGEESVTGLRLLATNLTGNRYDFNGNIIQGVAEARAVIEQYGDGAIIRHNTPPRS